MSISTLWNAAKAGVIAHKPEIMIGVGVTAGVGAIFMAVKETPACVTAIDKAKAETPAIIEINPQGEDVEIHTDLNWKIRLLIYLEHYWKAALLEATSIFLIIYGSKIRLDGYAALAAVYGMTKSELDDLKQVISEQSDNWKKKFTEKIAESHVEHSNLEDIPEPRMSNADVPMPLPLFWDDQAKVYFRATEEDLRDAIAEFTHMISTDPFSATSMNDWMRLIDHEEVVTGDHYLMTMNDPDWDGALKYNQVGVKESPSGEPARMMRFSQEYHLDTRGIYSEV